MRNKVKQMDQLFDLCAVLILAFHLWLSFYAVYHETFSVFTFAILFTMTRTGLAGVGHYHCHRRKDGIADWGDALFDMQYVGANLILYDGHVMLHHLYTNSHADVKRTVFTGTLNLPRLFRIPIYTVHRFGNFLTGMLIRWVHIFFENHKSQWSLLKHLQFLAVRLLLISEFFFCYYNERMTIWFAQFFVALWYNLFLIVSSHDFEESETKADLR